MDISKKRRVCYFVCFPGVGILAKCFGLTYTGNNMVAEMFVTALLLASAVSIDTMASGFAYGAAKIRMPFLHFLFINLTGSLFLGISLLGGFAIGRIISPKITVILSITALAFIGTLKILQYFRNRGQKPRAARKISWSETFVLSVVLSLDSIAVGLSASVYNVDIIFCLLVTGLSVLTDFIFFGAGHKVGFTASKKTTLDLSWISGVVLISIAISKMFF